MNEKREQQIHRKAETRPSVSVSHSEVDTLPDGRVSASSSLDLPADDLRALMNESAALVADYLAHVSEFPIFPDTSAEKIAALFASEVPLESTPLNELLTDCRAIITSSRHTGHPRYFGYVASSANPVGVAGDFIASALNQNLTAWRSSPAATEIERCVVGWLASLVGYAPDAGGLLTSGGSMANLNALYIAHRTKSPERASLKGLWNAGRPMTVYASDQIHLSIAKAADVLGLGREQVRMVRCDERFRLDVRDLRERVAADRQEGLRPFCVAASAGTVATGTVDPLDDIAHVAQENELWFHVDGAYGAFGAMDERKRALFAGMERADSVSLDPHKWLYAPLDCGCLLFRDAGQAHAAFASGEADYIKVYEEDDREAYAFWDYGVELTRRFRALKVWLALRYYGARHVAHVISENNKLAEYLAERVEAAEDFELLAPVELSICCFRHVPFETRTRLTNAVDEEERARINDEIGAFNERLMHTLQRGGNVYLSNANLRGRFALRACIVNFRTTRKDMDDTLDIVRAAAKKQAETRP